ncbi:MAG TPA: M1 family aminopeptidase [Haliscomenobacter sp.]|uniref:M1 family aminopeptidase n=1 Tax=Haliscomenobacter sp. TaxID=2717303 RepID=UPI002C5F0ED3|nr:M1 family aminopeptidase [Haliscomenobacter sp.]HOY16797.1 M1 family aminopeptidase [Haliscomenobacter sp.]
MRFLLIALLISSTMAFAQKNTPIPLQEGVSWELAQWRSQNLSAILYDVNLHIPLAKTDPITGKLDIAFELKNKTQDLLLDFKPGKTWAGELSINGKKSKGNHTQGHFVLPAKQLKLGKNAVSITFEANNQSLNRSADYLYTLVVPDRASTVFPCFDQPNLKARYTLHLDVPADWEAMGNGPLDNSTEKAGRKQLHFKTTEAFSTYVFAFCAGKFQKVTETRNGRSLTMLYRETDQAKVQRNLKDIFDLHAHAIEWMEEYTGIKLPFAKLDFALMPGFQYGGMEHIGAIFYREASLMLDENATENQKLGRASLIAHETAHMWFGDLVTMNWFNDVWLKEVFANFMAAKIVNPSFPKINHELRFLLGHQPTAYSEDRSEGSHPIQQELENLKNAGSLYGGIIYQKAPVVMRQLEAMMGEDQMRKGLQEYLRTYSYGNATWDQLIAILDKYCPKDLAEWSQVWVREAGMPRFALEQIGNGQGLEKLIVRQEKTSASGKYWPEQTQLALFYPDSVALFPVEIAGEKTEINAVKGYPFPLASLLLASPQSYGFCRLDMRSLTYFLKQTPKIADPLLRGAARMALMEEFLHEAMPPSTLLESILEALPAEQEPLNRQQLLDQLQTIYWRFADSELRLSSKAKIEELLWDLLLSAKDASARLTYFSAYQSMAETWPAVQRLNRLWNKSLSITGLTLSESQRIDLACAIALRWPQRADSILTQQLAEITNPDRKQRLNFIRPVFAADQAQRDAFFNSLKKEENRDYEPWVEDALGYLNHPRRPNAEKLHYVLPALELLEEIQRTGDIFFPRRWISAVLGGQNSAEASAAVRQFLAKSPNFPYRLRNKVLMAADLLFRAAKMRKDSGNKGGDPQNLTELEAAIKAELARVEGTFYVAFRDVQNPKQAIFINEKISIHPASTMKTPVLVEVFKQANQGKFKLSDSIVLKNEFKSIVDGSPYSLSEGDDSDLPWYQRMGQKVSIYDLARAMIVRSSNLATNMLIELVGAENTTQTMRDLGLQDIMVRRGVEDSKAYAAGLNNSATAYDLMLLMERIGRGEAGRPVDCQEMIKILSDQEFNDVIPTCLPADVQIAHKTGWITQHHHDSALIISPEGRYFSFTILSKGWTNETAANEAMGKVVEMAYRYFSKK